jgi:hypothetical protein
MKKQQKTNLNRDTKTGQFVLRDTGQGKEAIGQERNLRHATPEEFRRSASYVLTRFEGALRYLKDR